MDGASGQEKRIGIRTNTAIGRVADELTHIFRRTAGQIRRVALAALLGAALGATARGAVRTHYGP
jgi:hypothetical protein